MSRPAAATVQHQHAPAVLANQLLLANGWGPLDFAVLHRLPCYPPCTRSTQQVGLVGWLGLRKVRQTR
jgi:hypothetical protein